MTYTPPPATPPPMPGSAAPMGKDRTSLFGWLGIVIGFFCCPIVGIVLGVLSIRDAKKFGGAPTLGYIAIAVSLVSMVIGAIWGINYSNTLK